MEVRRVSSCGGTVVVGPGDGDHDLAEAAPPCMVRGLVLDRMRQLRGQVAATQHVINGSLVTAAVFHQLIDVAPTGNTHHQ